MQVKIQICQRDVDNLRLLMVGWLHSRNNSDFAHSEANSQDGFNDMLNVWLESIAEEATISATITKERS